MKSQMVEWRTILEALQNRDFELLSDLVRNDVELSNEARLLLAEIFLNLLSGNWKRRPNKNENFDQGLERTKVVERLLALESEAWPIQEAVAKVAEEFKRSARWVYKMKKEHTAIRALTDKFVTSFKQSYHRTVLGSSSLGHEGDTTKVLVTDSFG